ncbi:hypothetical protein ACIEGP_25575, partial [Citrobacter freundii]
MQAHRHSNRLGLHHAVASLFVGMQKIPRHRTGTDFGYDDICNVGDCIYFPCFLAQAAFIHNLNEFAIPELIACTFPRAMLAGFISIQIKTVFIYKQGYGLS